MANVQTKSGLVAGTVSEGLHVFKGIPYARPPLGELRFRPPEPVGPWQGVRAAKTFGATAPQLPAKAAPELTEDMSEDCLTLNVWSPGCDEARRPVMVWIHGGSFLMGSSKRDVNDGTRLARRGDVVVVSLNYRVGAFGFLDLAKVGGEDFASSGNLGLLDQVAALEWVRDNIAAFGGDPGNVTIFGLSAGGISIGSLLTMACARGLFHGAITQSGATLARSAASAETAAEILMEQAGVQDIEGLQSLSMDALLAAQKKALATSSKPDVFFGPVVDGVVMEEPPVHAMADGRGANVPLLTGTTHDEMRYWLLSNPDVVAVDPARLAASLGRMTGRDGEELLNAYRAQRPNAAEEGIRLAVIGDISFFLPAVRMAEAHQTHHPDTWMYLFTWPSPAEGGRLGSPHAIEQPFVFGNLDSAHARMFTGTDPARSGLSRNVQNAWLAFAKNGDPNHGGLPNWPPYDPEHRTVMRLDLECRTVKDPLSGMRTAWDGVPFDGIRPPVGIRPR